MTCLFSTLQLPEPSSWIVSQDVNAFILRSLVDWKFFNLMFSMFVCVIGVVPELKLIWVCFILKRIRFRILQLELLSLVRRLIFVSWEHCTSHLLLLKTAVHVPRIHFWYRWQRRVRLVETHWGHRGSRRSARAVAAWIVVCCAVARTVIICIVFSSCSILRSPHYLLGLREMLPRARLRSVCEGQASRVDNSIVAH